MDKNNLVGIAVTLALVLLGAALRPMQVLSDLLLMLSVFAFCGTIWMSISGIRSRNKYSIDALRRVHEKAEIDAIVTPDTKDFDSVQCLGCGSVFSSKLPVCPKCRRSQY